MDLRQIESFNCLYREASMTRAAVRLGIVQPALSALIARLEKDLGVRLFDRTSRGVTPTAAGNDLYRMLQPLSAEVDSVRQRMHDLTGEARGLVKAGITPSVAVSIASGVLHAYCERFPDVTVRLVEAYSADLIERVEAGVIDVAIANRTRSLGSLVSEPLVSEALVLVSAPHDTTVSAGAVDLASIPSERLVVPTSGQAMRMLIDGRLARDRRSIRPRLELDALPPTIDLVKTGDWVTVLPISAIWRELESGELRIHRITPTVSRDLIVVHHPRRPPSLAARELLDALAEQCRRAVELAQVRLSALD